MSGNVQETPPSHENPSNAETLDSTQLRSLFEAAPDAMVVLDDEGHYVEANAAACELFGLPREELLQTSIADFAEPGFDVQEAWDYLLSHGQARGEFRLLRPDGELRAVDYAATANFSPHRHLSVLRPLVAERSRSHQSPARQRHLVEIIERTSDLISTADAQGNVFFVNEAWQTYFDQATLQNHHISGFHPAWALEIILNEGLPEAQRSGIWRGETAILVQGKEIPVEQLIMYHPGEPGEPPFLSTIMRDITERQGVEVEIQELLRRTQILSNITQAIRNSLDLEVIVQNAVTAIYKEVDVDICTFGWCRQLDNPNPGKIQVELEVLVQEKHPQVKDWLGTHILDGFGIVYESILKNQPYYLNSVDDCPDEAFKSICDETGVDSYCCLPICSINGYWGIFELARIHDHASWDEDEMELLNEVSNQIAIAIQQAELYQEAQSKSEQLSLAYRELQDTQVQLVQAEKMSSLGQLVAGIAHEINNPVNFIYGNLQYAAEYAEGLLELVNAYQQHYANPPEAIAQLIDEIDLDFLKSDFHQLITSMRNGATRIRDIVKSLRTFSRLDEAELKAVDLHENIDSTLVILQNRLKGHRDKPDIEVIKNYGQLPRIECYSGLLNQVFMNVFVNAIDAIEQRQQSLTSEQALTYQGGITITTTALGTTDICISIRDNGVGMSHDVKEKIFNPFFTTKPVGMGTGMGLPTSYQIISKYHNGELLCNSTPGQGTELIIQLPVIGKS